MATVTTTTVNSSTTSSSKTSSKTKDQEVIAQAASKLEKEQQLPQSEEAKLLRSPPQMSRPLPMTPQNSETLEQTTSPVPAPPGPSAAASGNVQPVPVAVPLPQQGPAWQQPPQHMPPQPRKMHFANPQLNAPPVPASVIESWFMKQRDISYVAHGILKSIHIASQQENINDKYDVL
jgi:hypothetical protein